MVAGAHAAGLEVNAWPVDDPHQIESMIEAGVDGIISDFPDRVLAVLGQRSDTEWQSLK